jgi:hypothetical protein
MQLMNNGQVEHGSSLPSHLGGLARLHPSYSRIELEESHALLYAYFDLAWEVFLRLEQEGRLDEVLTGIDGSATVNGSKVESIN